MGKKSKGAKAKEEISHKLRRVTYDTPVIAGFSVKELEREDDESMIKELREEENRRIAKLIGVPLAIEYVDAKEDLTRRIISLRSVSIYPYGAVYWWAYCHMRESWRLFRLDRVQYVADADGVLYDSPRQFLTDTLKLNLEPFTGTDKPQEKRGWRETLPYWIAYDDDARNIRNGITVLSALGHVDGFMHDAEVSTILEYIAESAGQDIPWVDRYRLSGWFRRLRPMKYAVNDALDSLVNNDDEVDRLMRYSGLVIDADGVQHPKEFEFAVDMKESLSEPVY